MFRTKSNHDIYNRNQENVYEETDSIRRGSPLIQGGAYQTINLHNDGVNNQSPLLSSDYVTDGSSVSPTESQSSHSLQHFYERPDIFQSGGQRSEVNRGHNYNINSRNASMTINRGFNHNLNIPIHTSTFVSPINSNIYERTERNRGQNRSFDPRTALPIPIQALNQQQFQDIPMSYSPLVNGHNYLAYRSLHRPSTSNRTTVLRPPFDWRTFSFDTNVQKYWFVQIIIMWNLFETFWKVHVFWKLELLFWI